MHKIELILGGTRDIMHHAPRARPLHPLQYSFLSSATYKSTRLCLLFNTDTDRDRWSPRTWTTILVEASGR